MIFQVLEMDIDKQIGYSIDQLGKIISRKYGYKEVFIDFCEDGITRIPNEDIIQKEGTYVAVNANKRDNTQNFLSEWCDVELNISETHNEYFNDYVNLSFSKKCFITHFSVLIKKSDVMILTEFYNKRNEMRKNEENIISKYIDQSLSTLAQSLVLIAHYEGLLYAPVIKMCEMTYSKQKCSESKRRTYLMFIAFDKPSGEDNWETTDSEDNYYDKWTRISEHINDFVCIIMERKKLKEYMAEAVAWEAIKTEIVKITPQEFNEQYSRIRLSDALYESEKMIEKKKENRTRMLFEAVLYEEEMVESW